MLFFIDSGHRKGYSRLAFTISQSIGGQPLVNLRQPKVNLRQPKVNLRQPSVNQSQPAWCAAMVIQALPSSHACRYRVKTALVHRWVKRLHSQPNRRSLWVGPGLLGPGTVGCDSDATVVSGELKQAVSSLSFSSLSSPFSVSVKLQLCLFSKWRNGEEVVSLLFLPNFSGVWVSVPLTLCLFSKWRKWSEESEENFAVSFTNTTFCPLILRSTTAFVRGKAAASDAGIGFASSFQRFNRFSRFSRFRGWNGETMKRFKTGSECSRCHCLPFSARGKLLPCLCLAVWRSPWC